MFSLAWREPSIWALAVAQTIVWAGTYYLFPALLVHWEADFGWSKAELAMALTVSLLVSASFAPIIGRLIDRGHGRVVLTASAFSGGLLIGLLPWIEGWLWFVAHWALIGVTMAGCLYEPCFAFITRVRGTRAKNAIILITLVAGFAGTLSFPLANVLASFYHWQVATSCFAIMIIVIAVPLMWFGAGREDRIAQPEIPPVPSDGRRAGLSGALRSWVFWFLGLSFALLWLNHASLVTHLLPLLKERAVPLETAVLAISLIGPMQVLGRVLMVLIERWLSMLVIAGLALVALLISSLCLYFSTDIPALLFVFVAFQGIGIGISSVARPVVTAMLLGYQGFGAIAGSLAAASLVATALAPTLAAAIWAFGGYDLVVLAVFTMAVLALASYIAAVLRAR